MTADARPRPWLLAATLAAASPSLTPAAEAQVVLDGTTGPAGALSGPDYRVRDSLGRREGANLFHSFERFSIRTGESVTFSGPAGIDHVISRVTGGERSSIDGALRSDVPEADFWFVNPAGVVFGPNATLDVQGSFHVSTADELRFADGAEFSATDAAASSFTVAPPEAFGFLGAEPGKITVEKSLLTVPEGETLSLVGGDITIRGDRSVFLNAEELAANLRADRGEVNLIALSSSGEAQPADGTTTGRSGGAIRVDGVAKISVSGDGGGTIRVRAGSFVVDNETMVFARNQGTQDSGGGIDIRAETVSVESRSELNTSTVSAGNAGRLSIRADQVFVRSGSMLSSGTFVNNPGNGGEIVVEAGRLIVAGASISTSTDSTPPPIRIPVPGTPSFTPPLAPSAAHPVAPALPQAPAPAPLPFVPPPPPSLPPPPGNSGGGAETDAGSGDAGTVAIRVDELVVRDGGTIQSSTSTDGNGGSVTVEASEILISGSGVTSGKEAVIGDPFRVQELSESNAISSSTFADGNGGTVEILTGRLRLIDGGQLRSTTFGNGSGGEIKVTGREAILISGASGVFAGANDVFEFPFGDGVVPGSGNGGQIELRAPVVTVDDNGIISVGSASTGLAGRVSIAALDSLRLDNGTITAEAPNSDGGQILVAAGKFVDLNKSRIATTIRGKDSGAELSVNSDTLILDGSRILLNSVETDPSFAFTNKLLATPDSEIQLNSTPLDLSDIATSIELVALPTVFVDAAGLMRKSCAERGGEQRGSLVGVGRGGLPPGPDALLPSFYALLTGDTADPAGRAESNGVTVNATDSSPIFSISCGAAAADTKARG